MTLTKNAQQPEAGKSSVPLALQIQASGGMHAEFHNPKQINVKDFGSFAILSFEDPKADMEVNIFFPDISLLAMALEIAQRQIARIVGGE